MKTLVVPARGQTASKHAPMQESGQTRWIHQDPVTKSQRVTNSAGAVISTIDLDPWGGETNRSSNQALMSHRYTTYERDANGGDEAQARRYQSRWTRFSQPDPSEGSYDLSDPQSFNRYSYVQNDPVNFTDPSGLEGEGPWGIWGVLLNPSLGSGGRGGGITLPPHYVVEDPRGPVRPQNPATYPGGTPNPIAQLGPCPELVVPAFGAINQAAATLLNNTYGSGAAAAYGRMSTYEQAVFLNTAAAAASVGVNLSNAKFSSFYLSDKPGNLPYGFYVTDISGVTSGRHADIGSVEIGKDKNGRHIDVDLFNPYDHPFGHRGELNFNKKYNRPTHPGDVTRQLTARGVNSGVSCK